MAHAPPLTLAIVKRLVAKGESESLELKRSTGEVREGMESLCAFLNNRGGNVVFGVAPDGRVLGQAVADGTLHDVTSAVRNIEPAPDVEVARLAVGGGLGVVVVRVRSNERGPYTYDGRGFVRVGNTTRRMKREEFEHLVLTRLHAKHRWENLPATGVSIKDLDAGEIRQTVVDAAASKRLAAVPSESPRAILDRLHLLAGPVPTQAAVVLFGKGLEAKYPQCAIRLARFRGTTKSEFTDNRQFHGHAFELLRQAEAFLDTHVPIASKIVPGKMQREDRPHYPPEALREALVNALCHRDYSETGASIGVSMFDDRLEIWSWGRLPGDLTPDRLRVDHPSVRRNELIAEVFYRRGFIEKWGRGTQRIIEAYRRAGQREPEFVERAGEVGVRFWAPSGPVSRVVASELIPREREVLTAVASLGRADLEEIRQRLLHPPGVRMIQRLLAQLVKAGRVARSGKGRASTYHLAEGE